jgi:hypothetical protein
LSDADELDDWASEEFEAAQVADARMAQRLIAPARRLPRLPNVRSRNRLEAPNSKQLSLFR